VGSVAPAAINDLWYRWCSRWRSDPRYSASWAISSPSRYGPWAGGDKRGVHLVFAAPVRFRACSVMRWRSEGESTVPGQMALQRMFWLTKSAATAGQANHRAFAGAVGKAVRHAFDAGRHRRHVDDRAAAVAQHAGQKGADHAVHGGHVQVERKCPVGVTAFQDCRCVPRPRS
jgi:hypothetical protein